MVTCIAFSRSQVVFNVIFKAAFHLAGHLSVIPCGRVSPYRLFALKSPTSLEHTYVLYFFVLEMTARGRPVTIISFSVLITLSVLSSTASVVGIKVDH